MTSYSTRTVELGNITFTAPAADSAYAGSVWIDAERGHAAQERRQICYGGDFRGSTITATRSEVKSAAQGWLRQRRAWQRKEGL